MRDKDNWKPTRVIKTRNSFIINPEHVGSGSRYIFDLQLKKYIELLNKYSNGILLDCGCGNVPYYEIYKEKTTENICTDWEKSYNKNPHIDVFSDLNVKLNVDSSSFHTVLLTDVINHIHKPKVLFSEVARVLKQDGILILTTPFFYWINEAPFDYHRYTKYELSKLCEENNLKVIKLSEYGGFLDILFDMGNKILPNKKWVLTMYLKTVKLVSKPLFIKDFLNTTKNFH